MTIDTSQQQICFIDSNIWLYAFTMQQNALKTQQAQYLIATRSVIAVSTQVINEVCVNLLKKAAFTEEEIREIADDFFEQYTVIEISRHIIRQASLLRVQHRISFWDGLIVASALTTGAAILYSEDMHNGLVIQDLTIVNPFQT